MDTTFGAALRERRRAANISQRDLAEKTGLDFSYISKLENDRLPPPAADTVVAMSAVLAVPPEELLALTGKIPSEVQQQLSSSQAAQRFLLEARRLRVTDDEWRHLEHSLRG